MAELYLFDGDEYVCTMWYPEAEEESAKERAEAAGYRAMLASDLIRQGIPLPRIRRRDYVPRLAGGTNVRVPD